MTRRSLLLALLSIAGCAESDPVDPLARTPSVLVRVGGDWQRSMGLATLDEPLTIRAIDPVTLEPIGRLPVRFAIERGRLSGVRLRDTIAVTDGDGIARTQVTLGAGAADTVVVTARAGTGAVERFTILVSPAPLIAAVEPKVFSGSDTIRIVGQRLDFAANGGVVRFGGASARPLRVSDTEIRVVVPACLPAGEVIVAVTNRGARTESFAAEYEVSGAPLTLAPLTGIVLPAARLDECLVLSGGGARYLIVAQVESEAQTPDVVEVELGAGTSPAVRTFASAEPHAARDAFPRAFETVLRGREAELARGAMPAASLRASAVLPSLGSTDSFTVISNLDATTFAIVTARLRYFGRNVLVWVDTTSLPDLDDARLQALARLFDDDLYPLDENAFGETSDVDGNGRVDVVLTPVVNALTPRTACSLSGFVGGFFSAHDLFPNAQHANGGEFIYGFVPDSAGRFGCPHTAAEFGRVIRTAFVHELQHVINYQQHVFRRGGRQEEIWLNEGLSHIAEELASKMYEKRYPAPAGRSIPEQIFPDSAQNYMVFNLINAYLFMRQPYFSSVTHFIEGGTIEDRGAAWLFLRWLADQYGEDILRRLVQTPLNGKANITDKTGESFSQLAGEFVIALYADSLPGFPRNAVPSRYRFHSRNLRALFSRLYDVAFFEPFPITPLNIPYGGTVSGPIRVGGAVMLTLDVPAGQTSTTLHFRPATGGAWGAGQFPQVSIFRLQ
jgi:hypothetical protein